MTPTQLQLLLDLSSAGRAMALVTILNSAGSTPRRMGTGAIVEADGTLYGTIGGGQLEHQMRQLAVAAIASNTPALLDFDMTSKAPEENKPVCGGRLRLLIDPGVAAHRDAYGRAAAAIAERRRAMLITRIEHADPPRVTVHCEPATDDINARPRYERTDDVELLVEPLLPAPRLVVVGAGHVGRALALQARMVGLDVLVIDDRAEFARRNRYPDAIQLRCAPIAETLSGLPTDPDTFIALVSRGHLTDSSALAAVIRKPSAYIGMMGSRRKVALLRKQFIDSGQCTSDEFDRVHAPIGLEIGAETPEEIAVSIVAQLIALRRQAEDAP